MVEKKKIKRTVFQIQIHSSGLCIASGCFPDTMTELSNSDTVSPKKPKIFTIGPLTQKLC